MATKTAKQVPFLWEGTDRRGKRMKGELRSSSVALVRAELRRQGIAPLKVRKKPVSMFSAHRAKITPKDIAVFSRQLATMLSSGVPLVQAFDIIGKGSENASMQALIMTIKADVESGSSLAEALRRHPRQFDKLFCSLIRAGEQAGILETLLTKIAVYKEKTEAVKGKIKKAMFYPTAVIVVAMVITAILLVFVIPQFQDLFSSFGADLPAPTRFVIQLSEFVQQRWWLILGGIILAGVGFVQAKRRSVAFNEFLDRAVLQVPVFGPLLRKSIIARFARTLATMFAAGVPLVEAMESVADAAGNSLYTRGIRRMREEVATGQRLQTSMHQVHLFPPMVVQMVAIGEESGTLDNMLTKVADFFEEEVDDAVSGLSSLIEPIIMAVLGILIGGLVIAMYLPIFKMGQVV